jgi:hypothetical protein
LWATAIATPAFAGPPFLSDDPEPTPYRHYEIYAFADGQSAHHDLSGSFGLDFNYGATPDLQLSATLPIDYDRPRGGPIATGLGNVELAAKFRVLHQERFGLDVAVFPRIFLPAGSNQGEKHASLLLPLWIGRDWDKWSSFGGGGCALNQSRLSRNYCLAGFALTRRLASNFTLGGELFHQSPDAKGASSSTVLGLGATYDASEHFHLLSYIGSNLSPAPNADRGTGYASILFTF